VASDKGANFFYFPLLSNPFFHVRARNRPWLLESTDEMTDLIVIFSIRIAQIGKVVILTGPIQERRVAAILCEELNDGTPG
jgi:hypothetical protein